VDYRGKLPLDVTELSSHLGIRAVRDVFAPSLETSWQQEGMLILYELPHVKDGIPGFQPRRRLLDAGELGCVGAREAASHHFLFFEGACIGGKTVESFIENKPDVGVIFRLRTPRVEIKNVRMMRVHDDKGATLVLSAQNKPSSSD